jgi:hypothetical protein
MAYSMIFHNFNKVAAAATFLATVACLVAAPAEAITLLRFSGSSSDNSRISFDIDTSVSDSDPSSSLGNFPKAIRDFNFSQTGEISNDSDNRISAEFKFGNLTASQEDSFVKYEVAFDPDPNNVQVYEFEEFYKSLGLSPVTAEDVRLIIRIPANTDNLINSLSTEFPQFTELEVTLSDESLLDITLQGGSKCLDDADIITSCVIETINTQAVPEPSEITGLLGVGAIGAVLLLKRSILYRKTASS